MSSHNTVNPVIAARSTRASAKSPRAVAGDALVALRRSIGRTVFPLAVSFVPTVTYLYWALTSSSAGDVSAVLMLPLLAVVHLSSFTILAFCWVGFRWSRLNVWSRSGAILSLCFWLAAFGVATVASLRIATVGVIF